MTSTISQKYLFSEFNFSKQKFFLIQQTDTSEEYFIKKPVLSSILSKYREKVIQSIVQNQPIQFTKNDVIQDLISQSKNCQCSQNTKSFIRNKRNNKFGLDKQNRSHSIIFKHFKFLFYTQCLWRNCFNLLRESKYFQIVGRKSFANSKIKYFLIKYKFFDDPKTFLWISTSVLVHKDFKRLIKEYENQNDLRKPLIIDERFITYKNQIIAKLQDQDFKRQPKKLLGIAKISKYYFSLYKSSKKNLLDAQWYLRHSRRDNTPIFANLLAQIRQSIHNLNVEPYFCTDLIKNFIKKQQMENIKNQKSYLINDSQKQLKDIYHETIQIFMRKLKHLKNQIISFYDDAVPLFDESSEYVNINAIKQRINFINGNKLQKQQKVETCQNSTQSFKSQFFKQENCNQFQQNHNNDFYDEGYDSFSQDNEVKFQNQFQLNSQSEDDEQFQRPQDFYENIKDQCKEQFDDDTLFERIQDKRRKKSSCFKNSTIYYSKAEIKEQKCKRKNEDSIQTKIEEDQTKEQNLSISQDDGQKTKEQAQLKRQTRKVLKVSKFENKQDQSFNFYFVYFDDGKVVNGTYNQLIEKQGISSQLLEKVTEKYFIVKQTQSSKGQ